MSRQIGVIIDFLTEDYRRRIDAAARLLILADGTRIPLEDVAELEIVE